MEGSGLWRIFGRFLQNMQWMQLKRLQVQHSLSMHSPARQLLFFFNAGECTLSCAEEPDSDQGQDVFELWVW